MAHQPTWTTIDGATFGTRPDERGPIGGGDGYAGATSTTTGFSGTTIAPKPSVRPTGQPSPTTPTANRRR